MNSDKIEQFMELAGQTLSSEFRIGSAAERELGAKLLLSEVLEYVIKGLGVTPSIGSTPIHDPEGLTYTATTPKSNELEMIDGLADVAYTMYWNACAFGIPLEEAFELVCDNNLEKFVTVAEQGTTVGEIPEDKWDLQMEVTWPTDVRSVEILKVKGQLFAVGKDASGKVKKPSSYTSVDLSHLLTEKTGTGIENCP